MESKEKVELIELAIKKLMEDKKRSSSDVDDDEELLLTRLLSQLETLKANGKLQKPEPSLADAEEEVPSPAVGEVVEPKMEIANKVDGASSGIGTEEIVRELEKVKRQNFITHCLLSVMIVLTVAWQLSEVSLILKVKDGISHPFRSFGDMITGILKGPKVNGQEEEKQSSPKQKLIEPSSLPPIKIPELPRVELPVFDLSTDDD